MLEGKQKKDGLPQGNVRRPSAMKWGCHEQRDKNSLDSQAASPQVPKKCPDPSSVWPRTRVLFDSRLTVDIGDIVTT